MTVYIFGFPTQLVAISFPGKPRIITIECKSGPSPPGNFSLNGEPFLFAAKTPIGPKGSLGTGVTLIPGVTGLSGLPTYSGMAGAPEIVNPFSDDMKKRLYAWEQPIPAYISGDQTNAAAVLFLDMDNISVDLNKPRSFSFTITTTSHGTSTPVPSPALLWYLYYTGVGQSFPGPTINATKNVNTQSFLDNAGNLPPFVDPTNPAQVALLGLTVTSGDMPFHVDQGAYFANFGVFIDNPQPTETAAIQTLLNIESSSGTPATYLNYFPWAISAPYPGQGFCSWNIRIRSWRRANSFIVTPQGVLDLIQIIGTKETVFPAFPIKTIIATSRGANGPGCLNTITVNPDTMQFTMSQRFS